MPRVASAADHPSPAAWPVVYMAGTVEFRMDVFDHPPLDEYAHPLDHSNRTPA